MTEDTTPTDDAAEPGADSGADARTDGGRDVDPAVETAVEETDLPRRLKDDVYDVVERKGATAEEAADIAHAVETRYLSTRVDPLDPVGTVSAQSIGEPGTQMTMNTFHYAGVAEIDVTQGLPRLIELVDARKTPDTPTMRVMLEDEYATERERAHEVVWQIEATKVLALGDISTNVADMVVQVDLNEDTLDERWPTVDDIDEVIAEIAATIESELGVETTVDGTVVTFGPSRPSYRELLQLVEELREVVFKGIEEITRVVIRKEELDAEPGTSADAGEDVREEFVLYTEGSAFGDTLEIEGVDASRATCNNIHEIRATLGVEAARESVIDETMDTLEEQGLDDVNVRHLMLVADIMTNTGEIESIGRHGISGSKESVLARAAFEVTVSHLLDAATHGEVDDLNGVTENVIVGKPIKLGTGDVNLRMGADFPEVDADSGADPESADD